MTVKNAEEPYVITDQERLRKAEAKYKEIGGEGSGLRPSQLAERISRETGVGSDAARLVVMAHHKR
jgi:hypothetical protein